MSAGYGFIVTRNPNYISYIKSKCIDIKNWTYYLENLSVEQIDKLCKAPNLYFYYRDNLNRKLHFPTGGANYYSTVSKDLYNKSSLLEVCKYEKVNIEDTKTLAKLLCVNEELIKAFLGLVPMKSEVNSFDRPKMKRDLKYISVVDGWDVKCFTEYIDSFKYHLLRIYAEAKIIDTGETVTNSILCSDIYKKCDKRYLNDCMELGREDTLNATLVWNENLENSGFLSGKIPLGTRVYYSLKRLYYLDIHKLYSDIFEVEDDGTVKHILYGVDYNYKRPRYAF